MTDRFTFISTAALPTRFGHFQIHAFVDEQDGKEHVALTYGSLSPDTPTMLRIHSECLTGDALFSTRCDCGFQLERAFADIVAEGSGVILYLRQEGRGIGLGNKVRAYQLQDQGMDTVEANEHLGFDADIRDYAICKYMLRHLGLQRFILMTNNPRKIEAIQGLGFDLIERRPIDHGCTPANQQYLTTKVEKLGHLFTADKLDTTADD